MITVTNDAADHLKSISEGQSKLIRLGINGGGCAGFSYTWDLIEESDIDQYSDEIIDLENGGKLILDGMSVMYLYGSTVQLKKDVFGTVLEVSTPAAQSACGCGESVSFDMDMIEANQQAYDAYDAGMDFKMPGDE